MKVHCFMVFVFMLPNFVSASDKFKVFDSTLYKNPERSSGIGIPGAKKSGFEVLDLIYSGNLYKKDGNHKKMMEQPPGNDAVTRSLEILKKNSGDFQYVCLDFENWPLEKGDEKKLDVNINKYIQTVKSYKKQMPGVKFGFYSMLPVRNYYGAIEGEGTDKYIAWQGLNNKLKSLASNVDIIYPSLYTFSSNKNDWFKYAVENIKEARRYGKPVYVFLWPQYHPSVHFIGLDFVSADLWKFQLETAFQYADGVVIWGGWDHDENKQLEWDAKAEWWVVLKQFMEKISK